MAQLLNDDDSNERRCRQKLCVSMKLWLGICHVEIFIYFAIWDLDTNKSYEHNGDPWMKHVLNMQCLLFNRKFIICIFLHLLELQKVAKDINAKCTTFCRLWKVSLPVLPPGIPPLEWCLGRPANGHLWTFSWVTVCPIQELWFLSKGEVNMLLSIITQEILLLTLWVCLKWLLSDGKMKKRKSV